jgi:hypothetical protein
MLLPLVWSVIQMCNKYNWLSNAHKIANDDHKNVQHTKMPEQVCSTAIIRSSYA